MQARRHSPHAAGMSNEPSVNSPGRFAALLHMRSRVDECAPQAPRKRHHRPTRAGYGSAGWLLAPRDAVSSLARILIDSSLRHQFPNGVFELVDAMAHFVNSADDGI